MKEQHITPKMLARELFYSDGRVYWRAPNNGRKLGGRAGHEGPRDYRTVSLLGARFLEHRVIFALCHSRWPKGNIDHADGDARNNRIENLRESTQSQNLANAKIRSNNISGVKGVCYCNKRRKWVAQISYQGRRLNLGRFVEKDEAIEAYRKAATELYGEFARVIDTRKAA